MYRYIVHGLNYSPSLCHDDTDLTRLGNFKSVCMDSGTLLTPFVEREELASPVGKENFKFAVGILVPANGQCTDQLSFPDRQRHIFASGKRNGETGFTDSNIIRIDLLVLSGTVQNPIPGDRSSVEVR